MTKHILALTYKPKIPGVLTGKITQTIRPLSDKRKNKNDLIMFHGWSDKPYRSKWSFRTPWWKIKQVFDFHFDTDDGKRIIRKVNQYDNFYTVSDREMQHIAKLDGFAGFQQMFDWFYKTYSSELWELMFTCIRWEYKEG